jgi:hypothetical protein
MTDPIVYIDHSKIREGSLAELQAGVTKLVEFIEAREPQLICYGFYLDEPSARMTVVAVHPDAASLELHLEIGGPEFRKLADLIQLQRIEVYGHPSDVALQQLQQKAEMLGERAEVLVHELHAGFTRRQGEPGAAR